MGKLISGLLILFAMFTVSGCATVPGESFWEKGERNTFLACHTVPVIGCIPNLFFNVGKLGEKALSKDAPEGSQPPPIQKDDIGEHAIDDSVESPETKKAGANR